MLRLDEVSCVSLTASQLIKQPMDCKLFLVFGCKATAAETPFLFLDISL